MELKPAKQDRVYNQGYLQNYRAMHNASYRFNQDFQLNAWGIYKKNRPVKIITGVSRFLIRVQFFDRIDTPIRIVRAEHVDMGRPYQPKVKRAVNQEQLVNGVLAPEHAEDLAFDAFEDGWW